LLVRFSIKNFRSFKDAQELSFVAATGKEHAESIVPVEGVPNGLLRVAAIYGPNASGKSNLFRALQFFVGAIEYSFRSWKPGARISIQPFALDQGRDEVSEFRLDFLVEDTRFEYGFRHDAEQFLGEWLYSYPHGRKQVWFERSSEGTGQIKFGKSLFGENRSIEAVTRKNSLFLSAAAQNNHDMLSPIFQWLTTKIRFSMGTRNSISNDLADKLAEPSINNKIAQLISLADFGIVGITVESEPVDERLVQAMDDLVGRIRELASIEPPEYHSPRQVKTVKLMHRGNNDKQMSLQQSDESSGTVAFLNLAWSAMEIMDSGGVLCVDELDASLHPILALEIVRLFVEPRSAVRAQLIFNTHDVTLLDSSLLRRDQIWFTEKDPTGASKLYSLSDFRPRKNENLKRGYLQGRYGAVPYLGKFAFDSPSD
jgi:AAA15 family ATPase/GTPase